MNRIRYFQAELSMPLPRIAERLGKLEFGTESSDGFRITRVRSSLIEGHYFERLVTEESITDPFGEVTSYERIRFSNVTFVLSNKYPHIELKNPPRGTSAFFSRLSEATDSRIVIETPLIDPLFWAKNIEESHPEGLLVNMLEASNLIISKYVLGKITLTSIHDVRNAFGTVVTSGSYSIAKTRITIDDKGRQYKFTLAADSSVRCADVAPSELLSLIKNALPTPNDLPLSKTIS